MKTPSDDLFRIIKSMDSHEKRFFKQFGSGSGSLSYVVLFDAIDSLPRYDEELLKRKLKKKKFRHHLQKAKNYLSESLLSSLAKYNEEASENTRIQQYLNQAEQLYDRQLYDIGNKVIAKAEKLAMATEAFPYIVLINNLRVSAIIRQGAWNDAQEFIRAKALDEKELMEKIGGNSDYRNLSLQASAVRGIYGQSTEAEHYRFLENNKLFSPGKALLTHSSRKHYYSTQFMRYSTLRDWEKAYTFQHKWISYLETDTGQLQARAVEYLHGLAHYLVALAKTGRHDDTHRVLERGHDFYNSLPAKRKNKTISAYFTNIVSSYMFTQMTIMQPQNAIKAWERVKDAVSYDHLAAGLKMVISANLFACYFYEKKFHESMKWLNKIIQFDRPNRADIQAMARIVLLMVHVELGNMDLLPGLARSARRWLKKNKAADAYSLCLLDFFEKTALKAYDQGRLREAFDEFQEQLKTKDKKINIIPSFNYWLESKVTKKPLMETIRKYEARDLT